MPGKSADSKDFIEGTLAAAVQIMLQIRYRRIFLQKA